MSSGLIDPIHIPGRKLTLPRRCESIFDRLVYIVNYSIPSSTVCQGYFFQFLDFSGDWNVGPPGLLDAWQV